VTISRGTDRLTGRRLRESKSFQTKREAQKFLNARLAEIDKGTAVDRSKMTVGELMTQWLDEYALPGHRHA
jgi:integrase